MSNFTRRGAMALALAVVPMLASPLAAQEMTRVTYVSPSPSAINSFPIFVGIGEGYFAEEGIEVDPQAVNGSSAILQALASGQAQIGRPGPAPVIQANARGVAVKFLYNSLPRSSFGILVPEAAEFDSPDDLKGTSIGVGTADGAEVGFARAILNSFGMSEPADYEFIPVGDGGTATAGFIREEISAYVGSLADKAILTYRGWPMRDITPEEFQTLFGNGYAATAEYIEANPEIIEGFGRAMVRATLFTRDPANRERVLDHLAAGNPQEGEDREFANALLEAVLEKGVPHDMSKGWGYQDPEHWQAWHDNMVASGELEAPLPDLSVVYTNEFVEKWNTLP
ncbi:ABC transporter substrate-binding protein [Halovulum dunhuangense]|uniref:ABC transporter substrate-binding protein n=1 Tax=Halovulum dunhuangense TaxID=1505036 RepID=A0A849L1F0_9RHOB|nr:ABC transporter substrate-binding protein [Halovulum dunhuangense]NNU80093.1 ABC transporter substrate-binding protein [Halovulum dunhuangense]